jgi:hypothetical protein
LYIVGTLLIIALVVFFPVIRHWAPIARLFIPGRAPVANIPDVRVWVNTRTGLYYCHGTSEYGKLQPGTLRKQADALQRGDRPAMHSMCP